VPEASIFERRQSFGNTNANAKKKISSDEHASHVIANSQRHIIVNHIQSDQGCWRKLKLAASAMLVLDPNRRRFAAVVLQKELALREGLTAVPGLHKVAKVRRMLLALHFAELVWRCHRRKGEIRRTVEVRTR
jgi:hypothetical protein